jgi:release factor glutamine methyltransferase
VTDLSEAREPDRVYGPAEDSRLLAGAVRDHVDPGDSVLDVGTGSGYVATVAAEAGGWVVGSDVNPHACVDAAERGIRVVRGDLTEPFRAGAFDLVCFNPPYLPTDPDEDFDDWQTRALSGGESGRAVVEPFVDGVGRVLASGGQVLLLVSSLTDVEAVRAFAADRGFETTAVAAEKHPWERLVVLRLITESNQTD